MYIADLPALVNDKGLVTCPHNVYPPIKHCAAVLVNHGIEETTFN